MVQSTDDIGNYNQRGTAVIENDGAGNLRVRFSRQLFPGLKAAKKLSLGLKANNSEDIRKADAILEEINRDIRLDKFDSTLEKYKAQRRQQSLEKVIELYPDVTLQTLWHEYRLFIIPKRKPTTLLHYKNEYTPLIERCPVVSPYSALEVYQWLMENTTEGQTKRVLMLLNAAFSWGQTHSKIKAKNNPWRNLYKDLKSPYEKDEPKPNAFNLKEKQALLNAFKNHEGNHNGRGMTGYNYRHYYPLVQFWFLTGCRPSEAIGLKWGQISAEKITFNAAIVCVGGSLVASEKSKNNKVRTFPLYKELADLLASIKPKNPQPTDLVFPSPTGKAINYNNFSRRAWNRLADPIKPNTTPYSCRDTFITEQVNAGKPLARVAKWCDTSEAIIMKYYLDDSSDDCHPDFNG